MATTSEVKTGLAAIGTIIANCQSRRTRAKADLLVARNELANLATTFADLIATINAYTPTGAFESLAKDEKAKLQTEFTALKSALETELTALGVPFP